MLDAMIGTAGENGLVAFINEVFEDLAVVNIGGGGFTFVDELAFGVGLDVVLVAVMALVVLFSPAGVAVFLTAFRGVRLKAFRALPIFDLLVFLTVVALARRVDKACVYDTPFFGNEPFAGKNLVEGFEELTTALPSVFFDEFFEVLDGVAVGHFVAKA